MAIPEPMSASMVHLVPIKDIKQAPWNPVSRISERRLTQLRISVDDLGLYYPVLIDAKKNLIDGHRRLAVAKSFGWKRVPAITLDQPLDQSYGSVQLTQQKLSGNDMLGVYLVEPRALIGSQRSKIDRLNKVGPWAVKLVYDAGMTATVHESAIRVKKHTNDEFDLPAIIRWIVKHRMGTVGVLIRGGLPRKELADAIRNNKGITIE